MGAGMGGMIMEIAQSAAGNITDLVGVGMNYAAARKQADSMEKTAAEEQRRLELGQRQLYGQAEASAFGSGLEGSSSSIQGYLAFMKTELARQAEWAKSAAKQEVADMREAADWNLAGGIARFMLGGHGGAAAIGELGSYSKGNSKIDQSGTFSNGIDWERIGYAAGDDRGIYSTKLTD